MPGRRQARAHEGPQEPALMPSVRADQVRGDAVQPGPGAASRGVIFAPLGERSKENLPGEVVSNSGPDPPGDVAVDFAEVTVENRGKALRLCPGLLDHVCIAAREIRASGHHTQGSLPLLACPTTVLDRTASSPSRGTGPEAGPRHCPSVRPG